MIELIEHAAQLGTASPAVIKLIGVGGAGGNMVNSIIKSGYLNIQCLVANTDLQALAQSDADVKIQIGIKSTKGLGTGANPEIGKRAAEEDLDKVIQTVGDADIVFITGGMGGGTGTGAIPVITQALRDKGILTIAIVTKPFAFEGRKRAKAADDAIERLKKCVDTLIIMPNQKLLEVTDKNTSMIDAFSMINDVLGQSVRSICDIITKPGHINVDFADVRAIMKDRGIAVMGTGCASGEGRARAATIDAISSPLLENMSVHGARAILFNITGGSDLALHEISEAASVIYEQAHEDATIILGSVIDENMIDEVKVTIIATGFDLISSFAPNGASDFAPCSAQGYAGHSKATSDRTADGESKVVTPSVPVQQPVIDSVSVEMLRAAQELVEALKAEKEALTHTIAPARVIEESSSAKATADMSEPHHEKSHAESELVVSDFAKATSDVSTESAINNEVPLDMHDLDVPAYLRAQQK
jgi:cell division protein FtsZ